MFVSNCTYRKPINIPNATHVCETYKHTYIQYIHQLLLHGARIPYQYIFVPPILTFQLGACHCTFSSPNVVIPSRFLASNVVLFSCDLFPLSQHTKRRWITIIREKVYDSSIIQHQVTNKSSSKYRLVRRNITRKYKKKTWNPTLFLLTTVFIGCHYWLDAEFWLLPAVDNSDIVSSSNWTQ